MCGGAGGIVLFVWPLRLVVGLAVSRCAAEVAASAGAVVGHDECVGCALAVVGTAAAANASAGADVEHDE